MRATVAAAAASYAPPTRYVLFELRPTEVRCNGYGDVTLPERRWWRADPVEPGDADGDRERGPA